MMDSVDLSSGTADVDSGPGPGATGGNMDPAAHVMVRGAHGDECGKDGTVPKHGANYCHRAIIGCKDESLCGGPEPDGLRLLLPAERTPALTAARLPVLVLSEMIPSTSALVEPPLHSAFAALGSVGDLKCTTPLSEPRDVVP